VPHASPLTAGKLLFFSRTTSPLPAQCGAGSSVWTITVPSCPFSPASSLPPADKCADIHHPREHSPFSTVSSFLYSHTGLLHKAPGTWCLNFLAPHFLLNSLQFSIFLSFYHNCSFQKHL
jgi:hypothetical protein